MKEKAQFSLEQTRKFAVFLERKVDFYLIKLIIVYKSTEVLETANKKWLTHCVCNHKQQDLLTTS